MTLYVGKLGNATALEAITRLKAGETYKLRIVISGMMVSGKQITFAPKLQFNICLDRWLNANSSIDKVKFSSVGYIVQVSLNSLHQRIPITLNYPGGNFALITEAPLELDGIAWAVREPVRVAPS